MKHKIRVYDYHDAEHGTAPWNSMGKRLVDEEPNVMDVDAWCVGGPQGIRAFFIKDDMLYCASGDDGHWWLVERMHKSWLAKIKDTINEIVLEENIKWGDWKNDR